jgi:hypothetical protein
MSKDEYGRGVLHTPFQKGDRRIIVPFHTSKILHPKIVKQRRTTSISKYYEQTPLEVFIFKMLSNTLKK